MMNNEHTLAPLHGVLMSVHHTGLLIQGLPGIGKSSLALALLEQGHALVADDVINLEHHGTAIVGSSPAMLSGLLHHRELGMIDVSQLFGDTATMPSCQIDAAVTLVSEKTDQMTLSNHQNSLLIAGAKIPALTLNITSTVSVLSRLLIWLKLLQQNV